MLAITWQCVTAKEAKESSGERLKDFGQTHV